MSEGTHQTLEQDVTQVVEHYFVQVSQYEDATEANFALYANRYFPLCSYTFSPTQWRAFRDKWALQRIRQSMDHLYQNATTLGEFSATHIAAHAGVPTSVFMRLVQSEWRARRATLPTRREKVLATIQALVQANTLVEQFTTEYIFATAGVPVQDGTWFTQARHAAYKELASHQLQPATALPSGTNIWFVPPIWIDLDSDYWNLQPAGGRAIIRSRLRPDLAEIAWSLLQDDARSGELAFTTIGNQYRAFLLAGQLLGTHILNIHTASLEALQRAWTNYSGTRTQFQSARQGLRRLFSAVLSEGDLTPERQEMVRIVTWLNTMTTLPSKKSNGEFLSAQELNVVLSYCLADMKAGIIATEEKPDLLQMSTRAGALQSGAAVIHWGIALMILLMIFTGLRRQSIVQLEVNDWMEIRPGLFVLAWRHEKKGEENVAIVPALLAHHLQLYIQRTETVRSVLKTKRVFLNSRNQGTWDSMTVERFTRRLRTFVKRHPVERYGRPIPLGSTVLRRTFATRALYEGQSLESIRAQLGHASMKTTLLYCKFDQFEHPAHVRHPLDEYGRQALTAWHAPLMLNHLQPEERIALMGASAQRQQDVGLCRHDHCTKAKQGNPPPCSLCEHLVTGPEFLEAWKAEQMRREQDLLTLAATPDAGLLFAQMKCLLEHFNANFTFVLTSCQEYTSHASNK